MVRFSPVLYNIKPTNPKSLYKFLLKTCSALPPEAGKFYKTAVRKEYQQHKDEEDTERIEQIINRAVMDAKWILQKYNKK